MAKITKSSIFVDSKKLLQYTYTIYNMLSNKNKAQIGNHLLDANLKMIEHFSLAYQKKGTVYFVSSVNSYLGMMKNYSEYKNCVKLLDSIKCKNVIKDYINFKIFLK